MVKCIDISTGEFYNGLCKSYKDIFNFPYIHWFEGELSVGLVYTRSLLLMTDKEDILTVSLDSDVFKLLCTDSLTSESKYSDISKDTLVVNPIKFGDKYMYRIYISASSINNAEYITIVNLNFKHSGTYYVKFGADFYGEEEMHYINLSNMGVEIPQAVQKAIYSHNIREEKTDHILLNRKMKELLSNYWEVVANRGSYKSLINSLKWFEWGDLIKLKEIWKRDDFGRIVYEDRSIKSIIDEKIETFSKTTYMSLYMPLFKVIENEYDSEYNPLLDKLNDTALIWSEQDLMLKICLLGNFYETYFLPIHLDLFQSTLENVVFTNTLKISSSTKHSRTDHIYNIYDFDCNISDNDEFIMGNVKCFSNEKTVFKNNEYMVGADDRFILNTNNMLSVELTMELNDEVVQSYGSSNSFNRMLVDSSNIQVYNGPGALIEFNCIIPLSDEDNIIESWCTINNITTKDYKVFGKNINFKLLFNNDGRYTIKLQFMSRSGKIFTKTLNIVINDISGEKLTIYKIEPITNKNQIPLSHFNFSRNLSSELSDNIQHFIKSGKQLTGGVKLNNVLILKGFNWFNHAILDKYYDMVITQKYEGVNENGQPIYSEYEKFKDYTVYISKKFWFDPVSSINDFEHIFGKYIYRNDYVFFPNKHTLTEIDGQSLNNYIIYNDTLIVKPELPLGKPIDDFDWEFYNSTTGKSIKYKKYQYPIISNYNSDLEPGYYDIILRYKIGNNEKVLKMDSAFIKK